jgi:surfeit locus 1 family protein
MRTERHLALRLALGKRELRSPWWALLLTLAAVALFIALGRWQWQRAAEKRALVTAFAAGGAAEPLRERATLALPRYHWLLVRGRYDAAHQFLLDNISHGQAAGYQVLTPLELEDGRWLLVNRGWLPLVDGARARLPEVGFAAGAVRTLRGRIDELPVAALASGREPPALTGPWPRLTSFPRGADLAAALGHAIEPRQLLLAADEPDGFQRDWRSAGAAIGPERHVGYAIQWWCFAVLALGLFILLNLERPPA